MACTGGRTLRGCGAAVQVVSLLLLLPAALVLDVMLCSSSAAFANASHLPPYCGPFDGAVFPYWSRCDNPATYGELVELNAASGWGGLAPEWDESNSTYYVRLSENAATYRLSYQTLDYRPFVSQTANVVLINVNTARSLGWRKEGDEHFLVEVDAPFPPSFQFLQAPDVRLPCPRIRGAKCEAYSLLSFRTSQGLSAYEEDGAVYFKKGSSDLVPFILVRVSSDLREGGTPRRVAAFSV